MFLMPESIIAQISMCVMSCTSQSYNQMSNSEAMATGIILLSSLLLLVAKGYCIETFGLAGQHVVPSDISGKNISLDYMVKNYLSYILILYILLVYKCIYEYKFLTLQFGENFRLGNANPEINASIKKLKTESSSQLNPIMMLRLMHQTQVKCYET